MSNKKIARNVPIPEITLASDYLELEINKNFIKPDKPGKVAVYLHKSDAKTLATMVNEFLMYQNGNGPTCEDPNKAVLDKCIKHNKEDWEHIIDHFKMCRKLQKADEDSIELQVGVSQLPLLETVFLCESESYLSKKENKRINTHEFLKYFTDRIQEEANKQLKDEAA